MADNAQPRVGSKIVLGIDPGSRNTGYGIIRQQGRSLEVIESGTIRLAANRALAARLGALQEQIEGLVASQRIDSVAVEDIFTHRNARSALALGQARGVVLGVCGRRGLEVEAYPPATVKQAVAGHGRADKVQIKRMVAVLLGVDKDLGSDEADALAVAICHALRGRGAAGRR